jgi:hypothetical protein
VNEESRSPAGGKGSRVDVAIRRLERAEWRLAVAWSTRFVLHGTLVLSSRGLHDLAVEELQKAGWQIIGHENRPHLSLLEPETLRPRTISTVVITRVFEEHFTLTTLQPIQDDVTFMMATLGITVESFQLDRILPTKDRPSRWGLVRRSGAPRTKTLLALQAEHVTVGDRLRAEESWSTLGVDPDDVEADFGPNDLQARLEDEAVGIATTRAPGRHEAQTLAGLALLALATVAALALPRPSAESFDLEALILVTSAVALAVVAVGGGVWWSAARIVDNRKRRALRSWTALVTFVGATAAIVFMAVRAVRFALAAPPLLVAVGIAVIIAACIFGSVVLQALKRARRLRVRRTPWLVLVTSFGIVGLLILLNVPTALFLWGAGDLTLVGSVPVGVVIVSGLPLVVSLLVAVSTPALARWVYARASVLIALPLLIGGLAVVAGTTVVVAAWEGGRALARGESSTGLLLAVATPVCAVVVDEPAAPYWLLGTQGAAVHLLPRATQDDRPPLGGLVFASADTRFVSVDTDDDCS